MCFDDRERHVPVGGPHNHSGPASSELRHQFVGRIRIDSVCAQDRHPPPGWTEMYPSDTVSDEISHSQVAAVARTIVTQVDHQRRPQRARQADGGQMIEKCVVRGCYGQRRILTNHVVQRNKSLICWEGVHDPHVRGPWRRWGEVVDWWRLLHHTEDHMGVPMIETPPSAAFFDLDKTIIAKSSTLAFARPLSRAGILSRRALLKAGLAQAYYMMFGADHTQLERVRAELGEMTKGWSKVEIEQLVEETVDEVVSPLVFAEALAIIDEHRRAGRRVVVISSSPVEVVAPLGKYLGVDEVIGTRPEIDSDGRYTGNLEFYAYGPGKAAAIRELAERDGLSLPDCYAYSDSITDVPMLETVGHPVAVNPDRELRDVALDRDWLIVEFERPVTLRTRLATLPKPVPVIGGAAVAGGIAAALTVWALRMRRHSA